MYRMEIRCSNNQAEVFAILKALEYIRTTQTNEEDKAVTVHTDSMTTLDSLNNTNIHTFLIEEIRQIRQKTHAHARTHTHICPMKRHVYSLEFAPSGLL
jgi:ribonuclease HI